MKINSKAYAEDCHCGIHAGMPCPHTPIRCKHEFKYSSDDPLMISEGETRQCTICGFSQVAVISWQVTASSFKDYD